MCDLRLKIFNQQKWFDALTVENDWNDQCRKISVLVFGFHFPCGIPFIAWHFFFIRYYLCCDSRHDTHDNRIQMHTIQFGICVVSASLCVIFNVASNVRIEAETLLLYSFYLAFIWAFDVCDTQDNGTHFLLNLFATEINVPEKRTIGCFYLSNERNWMIFQS